MTFLSNKMIIIAMQNWSARGGNDLIAKSNLANLIAKSLKYYICIFMYIYIFTLGK